VSDFNGNTVIDITRIKDSQFGDFAPKLHDVRGLTFYVSDNSNVELRISDVKVAQEEIQRNPADESGQPSVGINWFHPAYTDYTTWTLPDVIRTFCR
jgi:hypothetical protein